MIEEPSFQEFLDELHKVLRHLYEPAELRRSKLAGRFGIDRKTDSVSSLRWIIIENIQALKPDSRAPRDSSGWRLYQVLTYRFVDQTNQQDVAKELALSVRQLRRLEKAAVETLAEILISRYPTQTQTQLSHEGTTQAQSNPPQPVKYPGLLPDEEFEWLKQAYIVESIEFCTLINSLIQTIDPLVNINRVTIQCNIPTSTGKISGQSTILRQALLNILTAAILSSPRGEVRIDAQVDQQGVKVSIHATSNVVLEPSLEKEILDSLQLANHLLELSGGSMHFYLNNETYTTLDMQLVLLMEGQFTVLFIDDNTDTLRLYERYLQGSIYRFSGLQESTRILEAIQTERPDIIVIDVMMPEIDGWELLGRLREHPQSRDIPVLVCTIMQQEPLAIALGAAAFLKKPISQEMILKTLGQLVPQAGKILPTVH